MTTPDWRGRCLAAWGARGTINRNPTGRGVARELKRKGVTLLLLWQEYRADYPDGYGYTWCCVTFAAY
jgi:hypothetical protein